MRRLRPTSTRLALVDEVEAGRVTGWPLTARLHQLRRAGWVAGPTEGPTDGKPWTVTPYGRGVRAVRLLDFGDHIVAECGDDDDPRWLGEAVPYDGVRPGRWRVTAADTVMVRTKAEACDELRHKAATVLAEEETEDDESTVLEGHTS